MTEIVVPIVTARRQLVYNAIAAQVGGQAQRCEMVSCLGLSSSRCGLGSSMTRRIGRMFGGKLMICTRSTEKKSSAVSRSGAITR